MAQDVIAAYSYNLRTTYLRDIESPYLKVKTSNVQIENSVALGICIYRQDT
ncbi:MAG TPA: hypothetical protein VMT12_07170 [Syntrophales bacterium]|nr:hypothetical protein [Syntrophales bacterium]